MTNLPSSRPSSFNLPFDVSSRCSHTSSVSKYSPCIMTRERRKAIGGTSAKLLAKEAAAAPDEQARGSTPEHGRRKSMGKKEAPLRLVHSFGTHCLDTGALLLDDDTVLHRTGRWIISQSVDRMSPEQSFVYELIAEVKVITALCISENRKYLAMCEQLESGSPPQLRVVHLQSRRSVCVLTAALEGTFVGCMFSGDSKHILAYTGTPDHTTVVWQWAEERPVGMHRSRSALLRVCFNPWMGSLISINSPMRLARLNDQGHFKEIEVLYMPSCSAIAL